MCPIEELRITCEGVLEEYGTINTLVMALDPLITQVINKNNLPQEVVDLILNEFWDKSEFMSYEFKAINEGREFNGL